MAMTGLLSFRLPVEPWNLASPKEKMPPSTAHHPVAGPAGRGDRPEDRAVEFRGTHVTERRGAAEGEDPADIGENPVAVPDRGGRQADGGLPGAERGVPEGGGVALDRHLARPVDQPVAVAARSGFDVDGAGAAIAEVRGRPERKDLAGHGDHPVPVVRRLRCFARRGDGEAPPRPCRTRCRRRRSGRHRRSWPARRTSRPGRPWCSHPDTSRSRRWTG